MSLIGLAAFFPRVGTPGPTPAIPAHSSGRPELASVDCPDHDRPSAFSAWVYEQATAAANLIYFAKQGTQLIFGPLAKREALLPVFGDNDAMVLGITICGTIILVAVISSLFYHLGVLQQIVRAIAWVMQRVMRTSGSESLCTSANVFMAKTRHHWSFNLISKA